MVSLVPFDGTPEVHLVPFSMPSSGTTIAPKGGTPREATAQEIASFDRHPERSEISVFGQFAMEQIADTFLAIPSAVGDALTVNPLETARALLRGEAPEKVSGNIPRVTSGDIGSAVRAATDSSVTLDQAQANFAKNKGELQAEFPIASTAGKTVGDVLSLIAGRGVLGRVPKAAKTVKASGFEGAMRAGADKIKRGAGKALEVGAEGAALATLQGGDPAEAAALAGGAQAFGSLGLTMLAFPFKSATNLAITAAGLTAVIQTFKALTPGGRDRLLESGETAFQKIGLSGLIGAALGISGAGRLTGKQISSSFPKLGDAIADAVNTGLRGPWVSFWKNLSLASDEDITRAEKTLSDAVLFPDQFSADVQKKLEADLKNGGASLFKP